MENMTNCKVCGKEIAKSAKACPSCGAKNKKPFYTKWWIWAIAVIIILCAVAGNNDNSSTDTTKTSTSTDRPFTATQQSENSENTAPEQEKTTEAVSVPKEYKSALASAKIYSETMHMSKAKLYDQLTSEYGEKFPADAAQYAIDNLNADYKINALETAKVYQDTMNMSKAKIYDQLTSQYGEKFTAEEAQYAIDNLE